MGKRSRTKIGGDCKLLEDKENRAFAMVNGGQKRDLRNCSKKSMKNIANVPNPEKPRKFEGIAREKLTSVSSKIVQEMSSYCTDASDNSLKSLKNSEKMTKSLCDSIQNVKLEPKKEDFFEINDKTQDPRITREAVVMLKRYEDIEKEIAFTASVDNSNAVPKNEQEDNKIENNSNNCIPECECPKSLFLKEAVVVLERCEDIETKVTKLCDSLNTLIEDEGKTKKVPNKSGKSTKRKREEKSKSEDEESSKSSKSKKQKESGESKSSRKEIPDVKAIDFNNDCKSPSGNPWNFKISSWNVNGIRAWLEKKGISYLHHEQPDILCIQETKCSDDKLPGEIKKIEGYHCYWLSGDKDGYSGVGLLSKEEPIKVEYGIGISEHDNEGRVITAEYDKFYLVSTYVPNAGRGLVRLDYRVKWDKDFREYLKKLDSIKPVILTGDLNVAHEEIDLANPKTNKKNAGFTKEERDGFSALLKEGFIDSFRHLYPDAKGAYTFWTYMMNARAKNVGWRLDYFVISERFTESLCDNVIRKDVFGSDHCPVTLFLSL